jgi:hypothetical protein
MTEKKNLGGRPSIYTSELAKEICATISTSTKSLQALCKLHDNWPSENAIHEWIHDNRCGFGEDYTRAKEAQADHLAEAILYVIDKPETYFDEAGNERNDVPMIRVKVDALKWHAMKLKPKKWGNEQKIEELEGENERVKKELRELREKLDKANLSEY